MLLQLTGVEFREVLAGTVEGRYGEIEVKFIGLEALLVNKRAAGRARDLADVAALEGEWFPGPPSGTWIAPSQ